MPAENRKDGTPEARAVGDKNERLLLQFAFPQRSFLTIFLQGKMSYYKVSIFCVCVAKNELVSLSLPQRANYVPNTTKQPVFPPTLRWALEILCLDRPGDPANKLFSTLKSSREAAPCSQRRVLPAAQISAHQHSVSSSVPGVSGLSGHPGAELHRRTGASSDQQSGAESEEMQCLECLTGAEFAEKTKEKGLRDDDKDAGKTADKQKNRKHAEGRPRSPSRHPSTRNAQ